MRESKFRLGIMLLMAWCLFFVGCTTQKKAESWMLNHKNVLASLCAEEYPVQESYIKGKTDTIERIDTIQLPGVKIKCPETKNGQPVFVDCPPNEKIYIDRQISRTDTIIKIDSAKISVIKYQLVESEKKREKFKTWLTVSLILNGILIFILLVKK